MATRSGSITCAVFLSLGLLCAAWGDDNQGLTWGSPSPGNQDLKTLQEDNARLHSQVQALENELSDIKKALGKSVAPAASAAAEPKPAETPQPKAVVPAEPKPTTACAPKSTAPFQFTDAEVAQLKKLASSNKKPMVSSLDMEFYGYVKADASHDSQRTSIGDYARWVESEQLVKNNGQFSLTANQTRLGVKATGPTLGQMHSGALVEIDFYGGGTENKPVPMMRHAYLTLDWPDDRFSILAGQTWDVISPLWMPTLNYSVGWWQGDIGYRRPQIRLTKGFELAKDVGVKFEGAITRDIGWANDFTQSYSDTGQDSAIPGLQGRASLTLPGFNQLPTTVGFSGHWAQEQVNHTNTFANPRLVDSESLNFDLTLPITKWLSFVGEAYTGRALDQYLGGIGQGFDTTRNKGIRDSGGWLTLTLKPTPKWTVNAGGALSKVPHGDVTPATARTFNGVIYGNVQYAFTANFTLGYEMSYLKTDYKKEAEGEDLREQMSLIYKF
ncbi:MAG TPA: hypothetical protein VMV72_05225 [Verrucomicrobiae bacterium]|nr:hypothetical protein [Verrucomicrobiae bacterium]